MLNLILFIGVLIAWVQGVWLGFQAGLVMGIIVLLVEPLPLVVFVVHTFTPEHINIASAVGKALGLH